MESATHFVKFYLIPGSLSFLMLAATVAVVLLAVPRPASRRAGRRLLSGLVIGYSILSLGGVADALQRGYPPLSNAEADRCLRAGGCAMVVLGSGMQTFQSGDGALSLPMAQTVFNALRASDLARLSDVPIVVWRGADGGGDWNHHRGGCRRGAARAAGVPARPNRSAARSAWWRSST